MAGSVLSPVLLTPFPRQCPRFMVLFPSPTVIDKFDYVFAENGTVQYKNGQLVAKQVGPAPLQPCCSFPMPYVPWGACLAPLFSPPQMPDRKVSRFQFMYLGGLLGRSSIFLAPSPPSGHPGPLGRRTAAGSDQLLSQLHGTAEAAQETVMARTHANGSYITDCYGALSSRAGLRTAELLTLPCSRLYLSI